MTETKLDLKTSSYFASKELTPPENQGSIIEVVQSAIFNTITNDLLGLGILHNTTMSGHENSTIKFLGELINEQHNTKAPCGDRAADSVNRNLGAGHSVL